VALPYTPSVYLAEPQAERFQLEILTLPTLCPLRYYADHASGNLITIRQLRDSISSKEFHQTPRMLHSIVDICPLSLIILIGFERTVVTPLLRGALDSLSARMHVVLVLLAEACGALGSGLLPGFDIFQIVIFDHGIAGRSVLLHTWW